MREILDPVDTDELKKLFKPLLAVAQRGKVFEKFKAINNSYLLSLDGTGYFSSKKIHCPSCMVKEHRDGTKTYSHQALAAVMVHPNKKEVIPFGLEPISNQDGTKKNDCERRAAERFLRKFKTEHPHLKITVLEDGLASNGPHIRLLKELNMNYILGVKPGDHKALFSFIEASDKLEKLQLHRDESDPQWIREYRYQNQVPLNDSHDLSLNFLEYSEWDKLTGKLKKRFSWVTDITLNFENIEQVMFSARSRWKIENETFNTLKNLGYKFEHNFGHGYKNLSNNLAVLMMLVFLVDQLQRLCCKLFNLALKEAFKLSSLWEAMRARLIFVVFKNWEGLFESLQDISFDWDEINSS